MNQTTLISPSPASRTQASAASNWCEYDHDLSIRLYQLWQRRIAILLEMNALIEGSLHARSFLPYVGTGRVIAGNPLPARLRELRSLNEEITEQIERVHETIDELERTPPPLSAADRVRDRINRIAARHNIDLWEDRRLSEVVFSI
jgi:hypothetical protein